MFEGIFLEKEIKEKLSELKEIDKEMYEYLLNKKIELNKFKVLKRTIEQTIKRYLARIMGYQKAAIKEYPMKFMKEYKKRMSVKELVDNINRSSSKKEILYVASVPSYNLVRQSIYLRKAGYETILLMETNLTAINFLEKYFDIIYIFNSIYTLSYILKKAKPYLIHVQGSTSSSNHFGILAKLLSKSKVVFNFYDIPSTTIAKKDISLAGSILGNIEEIKLDFFSEKIACERSDGLIFGYAAEAGKILKSRYSVNSPMLEFHSYTCDEFMIKERSKCSDQDGNIHLVYGGIVAPDYLPEKYFGDIQFHSLIEKLTKQGIYFDIYVSARRIKRGYDDYILMAEKNPLFRFNKGLLLDQATKEFGKYDFAAMIYPFNKEPYYKGLNMEEHYRMRIADKFFTYLEAGLPIIISEEVEYGANLVEEYEMGIVVSQKDLDNLSEIINSYDREKLRANVKRARQELSMKRQIGRLINFYDKVCNNS